MAPLGGHCRVNGGTFVFMSGKRRRCWEGGGCWAGAGVVKKKTRNEVSGKSELTKRTAKFTILYSLTIFSLFLCDITEEKED